MYKLTKYYTDNCSACKALDPILEHFADQITITKINCDDVPAAFLSKTGIHGVPTLILTFETFGTLREVDRMHGATTKDKFAKWLLNNIEKDRGVVNAN